MKYKKRAVTIYDVARESGTSPATASRVLSGSSYPVSPATRERVLTVAKKLEYQQAGGGKRSGRKSVAVIIPNLMNPFYTSLISGLEYSLRISGMSMTLMNTAGSLELEKTFVGEIAQSDFSGIVLSPVGDDCEHLRQIEESGIHLVVVEQSPQIDCCQVSFNYFEGGLTATRYLIDRGCRSVGFVSSPLTRHSRREVYAGYLAALEKSGIPRQEQWICIAKQEERAAGNWLEIYEYDNGMGCVEALIAQENLPESLFCANDITAIGAMHALYRHGLQIPRDISIIGFDNVPNSMMTFPALTTVDQSTYEMGNMAAELLAGSINDANRRNISVTLEPKLIVRESVR